MLQVKYFSYYIFLIMCAMSHVFSIKKKYKQAFKAGLAHSMGGLTPTMLSLISNPASIKSMGWSEIGHLLQNVLHNDYDLENSLEDLQELADENRIAYLSGLPVLAVFFLLACLVCLCNWHRVMTRIKNLKLGTNLESLRHQIQQFFKLRTMEIPHDIEMQRHRPGHYPFVPNYASNTPSPNYVSQEGISSRGQQPMHPIGSAPPQATG